MKSKHQKTLEAIFEEPIRRDIKWDEVVSLIMALGGSVRHKRGSARRFDLKGISFNIHEPHPQNELKRYAVKGLRDFLITAGGIDYAI
ncbi:MAG: type II toxin-antitoxin system HicA family toxin [bacterium]